MKIEFNKLKQEYRNNIYINYNNSNCDKFNKIRQSINR